jgi:hypothetical protein
MFARKAASRLLIAAILVAAGCDDDTRDSAQPANAENEQMDSPTGDRRSADNLAADMRSTATQTAQPGSNRETGRKRIRKPSGALTITPERPTTYRTRPGKGCVMKRFGVRGGAGGASRSRRRQGLRPSA